MREVVRIEVAAGTLQKYEKQYLQIGYCQRRNERADEET